MGPGGVAGGPEQGGWCLGRVSKGLGGWGLKGAGGLECWSLGGRDGRSLVRSFARSLGRMEITPSVL